ncbi:MAG: hypothetical protein LCH39_03830 [Proteobacteria bacterium]|nr:hypothetical protein [Pseudomonadota bacterium]
MLGYTAWHARRLTEDRITQQIELEVEALAEVYRQGGDRRLLNALERRGRRFGNALYLLADQKGDSITGNILLRSGSVVDLSPGWTEEKFTWPDETEDHARPGKFRVFTLPSGLRLLVGRDLAERDRLSEVFRRARSFSILMAIIVVTVSQGFSSEGFDKLWQKQIKETLGGLPPLGLLPDKTWWAIFAALALVFAWIITTWVKNSVDVDDERQTVKVLTWMTLSIFGGLIAFAFAPNFWAALAAYLACKTLRKANSPLMTGWLNSHAPDEVRATILSFEGQAHSVGKILGGPLVGVVAELVRSLRLALLTSAILLLPAVSTMLKRNRLGRG